MYTCKITEAGMRLATTVSVDLILLVLLEWTDCHSVILIVFRNEGRKC